MWVLCERTHARTTHAAAQVAACERTSVARQSVGRVSNKRTILRYSVVLALYFVPVYTPYLSYTHSRTFTLYLLYRHLRRARQKLGEFRSKVARTRERSYAANSSGISNWYRTPLFLYSSSSSFFFFPTTKNEPDATLYLAPALTLHLLSIFTLYLRRTLYGNFNQFRSKVAPQVLRILREHVESKLSLFSQRGTNLWIRVFALYSVRTFGQSNRTREVVHAASSLGFRDRNRTLAIFFFFFFFFFLPARNEPGRSRRSFLRESNRGNWISNCDLVVERS